MKKTFLTLVLFLSVYQLFAQIPVDYNDETRRVYWFDVNLKKEKDKETGIPIYQVFRLGSRVSYGTAAEYDKYLWSGLSNGTRISIGPFDKKDEAEFAFRMYDLNKAETSEEVLNDNGTYYWYLVTLKQTKRLKSYDFERIPAQVNSGNAKDFFDLMNVSLPSDRLVIGLFLNLPEAENSKRAFRLVE